MVAKIIQDAILAFIKHSNANKSSGVAKESVAEVDGTPNKLFGKLSLFWPWWSQNKDGFYKDERLEEATDQEKGSEVAETADVEQAEVKKETLEEAISKALTTTDQSITAENITELCEAKMQMPLQESAAPSVDPKLELAEPQEKLNKSIRNLFNSALDEMALARMQKSSSSEEKSEANKQAIKEMDAAMAAAPNKTTTLPQKGTDPNAMIFDVGGGKTLELKRQGSQVIFKKIPEEFEGCIKIQRLNEHNIPMEDTFDVFKFKDGKLTDPICATEGKTAAVGFGQWYDGLGGPDEEVRRVQSLEDNNEESKVSTEWDQGNLKARKNKHATEEKSKETSKTISDLEGQLKTQQEQYNKDLEDAQAIAKAANEENRELERRLTSAQAAREIPNSELEKLREQLIEARAKISTLEEQLKTQTERGTANLEGAQNHLKKREEEEMALLKSDYKTGLEKATTQNTALTQQLDIANAETESALQAKKKADDKNEEMQTSLERLGGMERGRQKTLQDAIGRTKTAEQEVKELKRQHKERQKDITNQITNGIKEHKEKTEKALKDKKDAEEKLTELNRQLAKQTQSTLTAKSDHTTELDGLKAQYTAELEAKQAENKALQIRLEEESMRHTTTEKALEESYVKKTGELQTELDKEKQRTGSHQANLQVSKDKMEKLTKDHTEKLAEQEKIAKENLTVQQTFNAEDIKRLQEAKADADEIVTKVEKALKEEGERHKAEEDALTKTHADELKRVRTELSIETSEKNLQKKDLEKNKLDLEKASKMEGQIREEMEKAQSKHEEEKRNLLSTHKTALDNIQTQITDASKREEAALAKTLQLKQQLLQVGQKSQEELSLVQWEQQTLMNEKEREIEASKKALADEKSRNTAAEKALEDKKTLEAANAAQEAAKNNAALQSQQEADLSKVRLEAEEARAATALVRSEADAEKATLQSKLETQEAAHTTTLAAAERDKEAENEATTAAGKQTIELQKKLNEAEKATREAKRQTEVEKQRKTLQGEEAAKKLEEKAQANNNLSNEKDKQIGTLKAKYDQALKNKIDTELQLQNAKTDIESLTSKLSDESSRHVGELEAKTAETVRLQSQLAAQEKQLESLNGQKDAAERQLEEQVAKTKGLEEAIEQLQSELNGAKRGATGSREVEGRKEERQLREEELEHEDKLLDMHKNEATPSSQVGEAMNRLKDSFAGGAKKDTLAEEIVNLKLAKEDAEERAIEAEERLRLEESRVKTAEDQAQDEKQRTQLEADIKVAEAEAITAAAEARATTAEKDSEKKVANAKMELEEKGEQLENIEKQLQELGSYLEKPQAASLAEQMGAIPTTTERAMQTLHRLKGELESGSAARNQLQDKETQLAEAGRENIDNREVYDAQIIELTDKMTQLTQEKQALDTQIKASEVEKKKTEEKTQALVAQNTDQKYKLNDLQEDLDNKTAELEGLEATEKTQKELTEEVEKQQELMETIKKENSSLRAYSKAMIEGAKQDREELLQMQVVKAQLQESQKLAQETQETLDDREIEFTRLERVDAQKKELEGRNRGLAHNNEILKKDNEELAEDLECSRGNNDRLLGQIDTQVFQIETLNERFEAGKQELEGSLWEKEQSLSLLEVKIRERDKEVDSMKRTGREAKARVAKDVQEGLLGIQQNLNASDEGKSLTKQGPEEWTPPSDGVIEDPHIQLLWELQQKEAELKKLALEFTSRNKENETTSEGQAPTVVSHSKLHTRPQSTRPQSTGPHFSKRI